MDEPMDHLHTVQSCFTFVKPHDVIHVVRERTSGNLCLNPLILFGRYRDRLANGRHVDFQRITQFLAFSPNIWEDKGA